MAICISMLLVDFSSSNQLHFDALLVPRDLPSPPPLVVVGQYVELGRSLRRD